MTVSLLTALLATLACLFPQGDSPRRNFTLQDLAGDYFHGDGLGSNHFLKITNDGRYSYDLRGCLGLYDCSDGRVKLVNGRLILTPKKHDGRKLRLKALQVGIGLLQCIGRDPEDVLDDVRTLAESRGEEEMPTVYIPIPWGERLFLVPVAEGQAFCNCVNLGRFSGVPFRNFYLREGDEKKRADGLPDVPHDWKPMLLVQPMEGKVVEVLNLRRARVDFGTENGAWVGMELWIESKVGGWAEVQEVAQHTCVIEVLSDDDWIREGRIVRSNERRNK